jgi:putative ABC transport system permease protein
MLFASLTLATMSLSLGLAVRDTSVGSVARLAEATRGFHVYVKSFDPNDADRLRELASDPDVAAVGGPWPVVLTKAAIGGAELDLRVQVRDAPDSPVDQPAVVAGSWLDGSSGDPGIVLEDGLATVLDVEPGDVVVVGGQSLTVLGSAMTVSTQRFPLEAPGLAWVDASVGRMIGAGDPAYRWLMVRLEDATDAPAWAAEHGSRLGEAWEFHDWAERRREEEHGNPVNELGAVLLVAGMALAALTTVTAGVLVAARLAAQTRQVGLLKAVGTTPVQVTGVLLVETVVVGLIATVVGLLAGRLIAPSLAETVTTFYGGPQVPTITFGRVGLIAGVVCVLAGVATLRPAWRVARTPTVRSLAGDVTPPSRPERRASSVTRASPVTVSVAVRSALRRRGRTAANLVTIAVGVAAAVLGLALRDQPALPVGDAAGDAVVQAANRALYDRLVTVVVVAATMLILIAAINTVITAVFAARDHARNQAVLRALGATPNQTIGSFVIAHVGLCLLACAIGLVVGEGLRIAWAGSLGIRGPSVPARALLVAATSLGYALAIAGAAFVASRRSVLQAFRAD